MANAQRFTPMKLSQQLAERSRFLDNEFGAGYVGSSPGEWNFGYAGPSPIEWRAKEHAECMASKDYAAAEEWLDEIGRELKVARHWLANAKHFAAQGGAK
jgi:hypothetical protein